MDYEKKYKEALERARDVYTYYCDDREELRKIESIFPELKESEDEKIIHWIRKELESKYVVDNIVNNEMADKALAWLEKQGGITKLSEEEQNRFAKGVLTSCALSFIDYLDAHKYEGKMCVSNGECEDIENAFHNAMWDRLHRYYCKYIEKQSEQKPVEWSEEDINMIDWLIRCCEKEHEELCNDRYGHQEIVSDLKRDCRKKWDWLESIKDKAVPQKHWKPTEDNIDQAISILEKAAKDIKIPEKYKTSDWLCEKEDDLIENLHRQLRDNILRAKEEAKNKI